jgi:hypothetical protein
VVVGSDNKAGRSAKAERETWKALEDYVNDFIDWRTIEGQLAYHSAEKSTTYAQVGQITVRVANNDGCLQETALVAVELLLWTAKFDVIQRHIEKPSKNKEGFLEKFVLKLTEFWFPIKYCEILDVLLVDPSKGEEEASNYEITFVGTLTSAAQQQKLCHILNVHKPASLP